MASLLPAGAAATVQKGGERRDDFGDDRVVRHFARLHGDIGLRIDRLALGQQLAQRLGRIVGLAASAGRFLRLLIRRISTSNSAESQIETPFALMAARVSAFMKAPPPVASTCGPPSSRRAITRASPLRKSASPWRAKMSAMLMPAAFSISVSASTKGMPRRAAEPAADRRLAHPHHADQHDRAASQRGEDRGLRRQRRWCHFVNAISVIYFRSRRRLPSPPAGRWPSGGVPDHAARRTCQCRAEHDRTRSRSPAPMG